jgi:MFS family permease
MDEKAELQHKSYPDHLPLETEQSDDAHDAHDPLNWSGPRKLTVLIITAIWTFLGTSNMIVAGPTLFPISIDLSVPIALTSYSIGGPLLAYGVASIIWVAFGNRFGVRSTFVGTATVAGCLCLWGARAGSFGELVAARTLASVFFASPETLGPQMVGDVFLLKDRAKAVSLLVIMQGSGFACGPLFGAFIVECVDIPALVD